MKMKNLGFVLMILSIAFFIVFTSYTFEIKRSADIICKEICGLGMQGTCPHAQNIPLQSFFGYSLSFVLSGIGFYLVWGDKLKVSRIREKEIGKIIKKLSKDERMIYELVKSKDGAIFQSELIKKTKFSKAKVSRILDKLEINGLIERRRRGMANLVVLK
jgi:DNA-binding transcriptional ArsR family regulator